jgi:hypothetical protein
MKLTPARASVLRNGAEVEIPTTEVLAGEIVVMRPGGKIPNRKSTSPCSLGSRCRSRKGPALR